jgi:hypothetical protein
LCEAHPESQRQIPNARCLLASETVERATDQTLPLYRGCVEARRELQVHEKTHGCHREILDELEV